MTLVCYSSTGNEAGSCKAGNSCYEVQSNRLILLYMVVTLSNKQKTVAWVETIPETEGQLIYSPAFEDVPCMNTYMRNV